MSGDNRLKAEWTLLRLSEKLAELDVQTTVEANVHSGAAGDVNYQLMNLTNW